jgi:hypothetical protein
MLTQSLRISVYLFSLVLALSGVCRAQQDQKTDPKKATPEQEVQIRALLEQLVLMDREAPDPKKLIEKMREGQVEESLPPMSPELQDKPDPEYAKRFKGCQKAFKKLSELKVLAFPYMVEHLNDKRQSIPFRNHSLQQSVGDACYWNIYYQLQDQPEDYSEYGYDRKGKDGKDHPKPYWKGTPFDEAGGLAKWLEANRKLSYTEMQIKCLTWLLEEEKRIGASDPESYFLNILPLEIRILERKSERGEDVKEELSRLRDVLKRKDTKAVPKSLLPTKAEQVVPSDGHKPSSSVSPAGSTAPADAH